MIIACFCVATKVNSLKDSSKNMWGGRKSHKSNCLLGLQWLREGKSHSTTEIYSSWIVASKQNAGIYFALEALNSSGAQTCSAAVSQGTSGSPGVCHSRSCAAQGGLWETFPPQTSELNTSTPHQSPARRNRKTFGKILNYNSSLIIY